MHLSFLTSHNLLFFRFCKTSKKTTFSVFLSFFLVKSPKSQSLKLNISRTAWPILMILVSFCRILNGLSDEINLFWRCSSPLRNTILTLHIIRYRKLHINSFQMEYNVAVCTVGSLNSSNDAFLEFGRPTIDLPAPTTNNCHFDSYFLQILIHEFF